MEEQENKKNDQNDKIEIVKGKSDDLEISDVKDNLTFEVTENNSRKKGEIIVPKNKKISP